MVLNLFKKCSSHEEGFSIVEIILVLAIITVLGVVLIPNFSDIKKNTDLNGVSQEISSILLLAKSKTLASEDYNQYGVYFDASSSSDSYTLFKGSSYASRDSSYDIIRNLPNSIEIFNIDLQGGNEAVFERLTGFPQQSGSVAIRLIQDTSKTKIIYLSGSGIVSLSTPVSPSDNDRVKDSRHVRFDYARFIDTATENISLNFDNGSHIETISFISNIYAGQLEWSSTIDVGGTDQVITIRTTRLNNPNTQFVIHRDRRYNTVQLETTISGDISGSLAEYSADGLSTSYDSLYVDNFVWQ